MFAPWRSQKSLRKHKDLITGNSFIGYNKSLDLIFLSALEVNPQQEKWLRSVFVYTKIKYA